MNAPNWLRKAAAQALDLAAEAYGSLATWCVRTSEQLDPYTADDYRHAAKVIQQAAEGFPRAELRDVNPLDDEGWPVPVNPARFAPSGFEQPTYWFNESDWQPRTPSDGQEHRYDETCGGCTCGWPTGTHPSEARDE